MDTSSGREARAERKTIVIGGLGRERVHRADLKTAFKNVGLDCVERCEVGSHGFAKITFRNERDAADAVRRFNGGHVDRFWGRIAGTSEKIDSIKLTVYLEGDGPHKPGGGGGGGDRLAEHRGREGKGSEAARVASVDRRSRSRAPRIRRRS